MREIALFVEDHAHRQVIGALVQRIAEESDVAIQLDWRNAVGGHGKIFQAFCRGTARHVSKLANMTLNDIRLIEVAFPLKEVSLNPAHDKNGQHGHISTLHISPRKQPPCERPYTHTPGT
jgi:hypothetical protein